MKNISSLTQQQWLQVAKCVDNGFIGSEKTFTAYQSVQTDRFILTTNVCDDCSIVLVNHDLGVLKSIDVIDEDSDRRPVQPETFNRIINYLKTI